MRLFDPTFGKNFHPIASNRFHICGETVLPGQSSTITASIARLPSRTAIDLPIYVFRSREPGPIVLLSGGLHGDEINGVEIVRRMLERKTFKKLLRGTVVAVPVMNIFGFLNFSREVPDGKDINRSFPGQVNGSLASRVAHFLTKNIISTVDVGVDFHTGGASRHNYPQVRYAAQDPKAFDLAKAFDAPVIFQSNLIEKSLRKQAFKMGKTILVYEGGESLRLDEYAISEGIAGAQRFLKSLGMLKTAPSQQIKSKQCTNSSWLRAKRSGIYTGVKLSGSEIKKGDLLGYITDPFGEFRVKVHARQHGIILGHNNMPIVHQGDALLHIGDLG